MNDWRLLALAFLGAFLTGALAGFLIFAHCHYVWMKELIETARKKDKE